MEQSKIDGFGDQLFDAMTSRTTIAPLTEQAPEITIEDAYKISRRMLARRLDAGEKVVGKKIGVTSKPVMDMLNVNRPDFGFLTDTMAYSTGAEVPLTDNLIQAKAEGEIAFILKSDLKGPGVTNADVIRATDFVMPCFEIVDSRIRNWEIKRRLYAKYGAGRVVAEPTRHLVVAELHARVEPRRVDEHGPSFQQKMCGKFYKILFLLICI